MPAPTPVIESSFLGSYTSKGAYTDCYSTTVSTPVTLPQFVEAFYTTRLFKLERWLLAKVMKFPASDEQAALLAQGKSDEFSAWKVENRSRSEILLAAFQTRSWLSVEPQPGKNSVTTLYFGSAVVPTKPDGELDMGFRLLLGFHKLYSKLLLSAAAKRVVALNQ